MTALDEVLDAWKPGIPINQQGGWAQAVGSALDARMSVPTSDVVVGQDRAWTLLGWCENSATEAVRGSDLHLLELAVFGLGLVSQAEVEGREVLLVGSLLRRAAKLIGVSWNEFCQRFAGDDALSKLLNEFPPKVSLASHREEGSGQNFRFEKVRLARWDEEELLRRLDGH